MPVLFEILESLKVEIEHGYTSNTMATDGDTGEQRVFD
jgi:hypothetical protein